MSFFDVDAWNLMLKSEKFDVETIDASGITSCIRLIDGVSCHNAFTFYLDSTNLGIGTQPRDSFVTSVTC